MVLAAAAGSLLPASAMPAAKSSGAGVAVLSSDEIVASALLSASDAPIGYVMIELPEQEPSRTGGYCGGPNLLTRANDQQVVGFGEVGFAHGGLAGRQFVATDQTLVERIFSFPTVKRADAFLRSTRRQAECHRWEVVSDGNSGTESVRRLPSPSVGDEADARRLVISVPGMPKVTADQIAVRVENNVVVLAAGGPNGPTPKLSSRYLRKSVAMLMDATREKGRS